MWLTKLDIEIELMRKKNMPQINLKKSYITKNWSKAIILFVLCFVFNIL